MSMFSTKVSICLFLIAVSEIAHLDRAILNGRLRIVPER
jgi:hypothetical protein